MRLSELSIGKSVKIEALPKTDALSHRLFEMGFHEGMTVRAVLSYGELYEYKIGETLVALKPKECKNILIK